MNLSDGMKYSLLCILNPKQIEQLVYKLFAQSFDILNKNSSNQYKNWLDKLDIELTYLETIFKDKKLPQDLIEILKKFFGKLKIDNFLFKNKKFKEIRVFMNDDDFWFKETPNETISKITQKKLIKILNKIQSLLKK